MSSKNCKSGILIYAFSFFAIELEDEQKQNKQIGLEDERYLKISFGPLVLEIKNKSFSKKP